MLSRSTVTVSVFEAVVVRPVPPEIVRVSVPEVIVWAVPPSPATVNEVAILAMVLLTFEIALSV